jgi:hypothetical protein
MRALEALKAARAAGVDITLDGEDLVLQAPAPPPALVLDALSRNKAEIVALLRLGNDRRTGEDWQAFDHEQADVRLSGIPAETKGISWAEWKAATLNRLFQEQGIAREPGRISTATVLHGERRMSEPTSRIRQAAHRSRGLDWETGND